MKISSLILFLTALICVVSLKLLITNQENKINNIKREIVFLENDIEKILNNITYETRPQKLSKINTNEFQLLPILQKDIIKLENITNFND